VINSVRKIMDIIYHDDRPFRRLLSILIMRLPFDIGNFIRITISVQNYFIRLRQSALSMVFWVNPKIRASDFTFITKYLKQNDIYIDVGANIGTTLIPAAKVIKEGRAIGFEPHPKIFLYLKENISLNNLENSVEVHNCALGNARGNLCFSSIRSDDQNKVLSQGEGIKVPAKLLDDFGGNLSKVDLLKIDVEGYEKFVIEGGIETVKKTLCIYFEVCEEHFGWFDYSVSDLLILLEKMGFYLFQRVNTEMLESINCGYKPCKTSNLFAIRNIEDFLERTGWRICYRERKIS